MKTVYQSLKPKYLVIAITSFLALSAFVLTNRLVNPADIPDNTLAADNTAKGSHDPTESGQGCVVRGWACDGSNYSLPIYVHIYEGNQFIDGAAADDGAEQGVTDACGGYANHRFTYNLPNSYKDGSSHAFTIYAIGIDTSGGSDNVNPKLVGTPQTVTCDKVTITPTPAPTEGPIDNTGYAPVVLTAEEQVINNEASNLFSMIPTSGSTFVVDFDYKKDKYLIKLFGKNSKEDFNKWAIEKKMTNIPTDYYILNDPPQNPGDANSDSQTDGKDFLVWLKNYSSTSNVGITNGDYYTDGAIDIKDYLIWITSY